MPVLTFDPTKSCPIIKGMECVQTDCGFWNPNKSECVYWDGLAGKNGYNEITGTCPDDAAYHDLDLGVNYKDITIFVTGDATIYFDDNSGDLVNLSAATSRVNTPLVFKGINAQHIWMECAGGVAVDYCIFGNG